MDNMIPNLRDQNVQSAVKNLVTYSLVILLVPLGSMFILKAFLFERFLGYGNSDSMMFSAIIAVILVHVVLVLWIWTANNEGKPKKE
ncbi:vacuolar ATPase assembly integral membrane protein VMA21 [Aphelenchoides avenae]|nr:vacuolar ATPase assembly integral membrane protein VMA21 [Aphelenchus avenae]